MAGKVILPEFEDTALEAVASKSALVRAFFDTHQTKNVEWRKTQLRKLYWALEDYKPQILEALHKDLRKSAFETTMIEIDWIKEDCLFTINHLDGWVKDEKVEGVPLIFCPMKVRIRKEPIGTVLIIGPFNYPIMLVLCPLIGAIAAGCTAVLKPSEITPNSAMVIKEMIEKRLDPSAYTVVNGGIPQMNALLNEKWDKIFFTGSKNVGTIIAKKAAETLTPVTLELGGKNPAFITKQTADLELAAKRMLFGKSHNAGQVCCSQNYCLVERDVVDTFIQFLNAAFKESFPNGAKASPDLSHMVTITHFNRIKKLLDSTKGKVVMGGELDASELFISPTAVLVESADDPLVQEETFGPVFSIVPFDTLDEALKIAKGVMSTPLALFTFGSKNENIKVLNEMTSGGASFNDSFMHGSITMVPFGGVGESGYGSCRGKASWEAFTHRRTVAESPFWLDRFGLLRIRYMPYDWDQYRRKQVTMVSRVGFDRDGRLRRNVLSYWLGVLFGLGAKSAPGALFRWLVILGAGCLTLLKRGGGA